MRKKLLTEKEFADMVSFIERIIARAVSTTPIDHKKAEEAYNKLLTVMGHEPVKNFYWFDSPYALHSQLENQLGNQLENQLWDQLWDQLGNQLWDQLWDQLRNQLDQFELQYYMWKEYVSQLDGVEADEESHKKLKALSELGEHAFWIIPLKDGAALCERPIRLVRDDNHNLHYDHDAAIEFPDGYKQHYLHGVYFEEEMFNRIVSQEMTLEEVAKIGSADKSAVAIQFLRPDRLLEQVGAKLINVGKHDGTELYEVPNFMETGETEFCIKMAHPTVKDKYFIEWVHPDIAKNIDADMAQAVAFEITKRQYLNSINR